MRPLVGLDVGTTAVKAVAVSESGEVVARAERGSPLSTPQPGWCEQDPDDWWTAAQAALADLGVEPAAIGLSGQMHGLVALDKHDRVLRPAILWNDQRTGEQCTEIEERVGFKRLVALTGNRAFPGFTAPKLLWVREHEPEVYARIAHVLLPKDYVRLRLTGERATDVADASGTLLLDVGARRWSEEVVEALGLDLGWLPPVLESPEVSGTTRDGVSVAAGAGDQAAGAIGVGVDRPGTLSVVLGTSGVVFAALPAFARDPQGRVHAFCHAVPEGWHAMGVMLSAAGSFAWLRQLLAAPYDDLLAEAERCPAGVEGALFAPYLSGERTPHADPDARGAFTGLSLRHGRGALVRAVLEGVAYGLRDSLELLRELDIVPEVGRISGGGARSALWTRIVASTLGLPLERTAVEEGAAFGAALLGGVAAGAFADVHEAVSACVHVRETVEPVSDWVGVYRDRLRALPHALSRVAAARQIRRTPHGRSAHMTMRADVPAAHAVAVRRKVTAIPAAVLAAALLAACGSTQSQPKVYTSPAAPGYVMPAGQHFQGRGSKTLGTIVVHKLSKLQWASDGVVFQLGDAAQRIKVRTQEHAGTLTLRPGTYKKVEVLAFGNWLITITPG